MPLPLTVSWFSKIHIGFTFLAPAHPGSPGQRAVKGVYVRMYVRMYTSVLSEHIETTLGYLSQITVWCRGQFAWSERNVVRETSRRGSAR